jgi:hypothetical protein
VLAELAQEALLAHKALLVGLHQHFALPFAGELTAHVGV